MATQADFASARVAATAAADQLFAAAQAAYPADMAEFRRRLADFRRAKDVEKEASAREIVGSLRSPKTGGDARLREAVVELEAEIERQKAQGDRANRVATAIHVLLGTLLIFAI